MATIEELAREANPERLPSLYVYCPYSKDWHMKGARRTKCPECGARLHAYGLSAHKMTHNPDGPQNAPPGPVEVIEYDHPHGTVYRTTCKVDWLIPIADDDTGMHKFDRWDLEHWWLQPPTFERLYNLLRRHGVDVTGKTGHLSAPGYDHMSDHAQPLTAERVHHVWDLFHTHNTDEEETPPLVSYTGQTDAFRSIQGSLF